MAGAWTCSECQHHNSGGALCELCGLALHYQIDPPLDLPRRPDVTVLPEFWMGIVWLAAALLTLALMLPWARTVLGFAPWWVALQTTVLLLASGGSFIRGFWKRELHRLQLTVPRHSRSGGPLEVRVEVTPYARVTGLHLTVELVERQWVRSGKSGSVIRSRLLARQQLHTGSALDGRRAHVLGTDFITPVATGRYMNLMNEMSNSLVEALARFVPFLGLLAFNTAQDGGFYVLMKARIGPFRQLQIRRVVVWTASHEVLVG